MARDAKSSDPEPRMVHRPRPVGRTEGVNLVIVGADVDRPIAYGGRRALRIHRELLKSSPTPAPQVITLLHAYISPFPVGVDCAVGTRRGRVLAGLPGRRGLRAVLLAHADQQKQCEAARGRVVVPHR